MVDILDSVKAYLEDNDNDENSNNDKQFELNNNKIINNDKLHDTLWQRIKRMTKKVEWDEIQLIIGNDIVENNEMLYNEVKILKNVLNNLEKRNMKQLKLSISSSLYGETQLHQMLKSEIAILANKLPSNELNRETPRNREIIEYALSNESNSRPTSSSLNRIRHTSLSSLRAHSRPASGATRTSSGLSIRSYNSFHDDYPDHDIEHYQSKLNVLDINEILNHIHNAFHKEKEYLLKWIEYLHECIDELEKDNSEVTTPIVPTVTELRDFGHVLRDRIDKHHKHLSRLERFENIPSSPLNPLKNDVIKNRSITMSPITNIKAPPRGKLKPVRPSTARRANISPLLKRKLVRKTRK